MSLAVQLATATTLGCFGPTDPDGRPGDGSRVILPAGTHLQSVIDAYPPGTRFLLGSGIHLRQSIVARSGDSFIGDEGAVLDGDSATQYAISGRFQASAVRIEGLEIRNYAPPAQWAAINGVNTRDWVVVGNEVHHNVGGIRIGAGMHVRDNRIHHNGQTGILGQGDGARIEANEVFQNNWLHEFDPSFEAGGIKITFTTAVRIAENHVHHNGGVGIWLDIDNQDPIIEGNRVESNERQGIFLEIGYGGVVRDNEIRDNGFQGVWHHRGGIVIASTADVEVHSNRLEGNALGIIASQQPRGGGALGPYVLENLFVHHNEVIMETGFTGVVSSNQEDDALYRTGNNRFADNAYVLGPGATHFTWDGLALTAQEWRALGHDTAGSFNVLEGPG